MPWFVDKYVLHYSVVSFVEDEEALFTFQEEIALQMPHPNVKEASKKDLTRAYLDEILKEGVNGGPDA